MIYLDLLSIDPGRNTGRSNQGTGFAGFYSGKLVAAGKGDPLSLANGFVVSPKFAVVIEVPRWYPRERGIDTNDLLDLAVLAGRYSGRFESHHDVEFVYPRSWKGTVPPDICCRRVLDALSEKEVALLPRRPRAGDVDHNVLDAVGIGLWKLRRFGS